MLEEHATFNIYIVKDELEGGVSAIRVTHFFDLARQPSLATWR